MRRKWLHLHNYDHWGLPSSNYHLALFALTTGFHLWPTLRHREVKLHDYHWDSACVFVAMFRTPEQTDPTAQQFQIVKPEP